MRYIALPKARIDRIFSEATEQVDYVVDLYRAVIERWDSVQSVNSYPQVNEFTSQYITRLAMQFDEDHHPDCLAGGCWLSKGFATGEVDDLPDFVALVEPGSVAYGEEVHGE